MGRRTWRGAPARDEVDARRVAIVDYGMCNLDSVRRAFEEVGARPFVTDDPGDLDAADRIVLPGVGAFPDAMPNLRARGLDDALAKQVWDEGAPFLGVCLGMQLMAAIGHEVEADGRPRLARRVLRSLRADRRRPACRTSGGTR